MEENKALYFFVDESGDPTFFNKRGEYIVGQEGCSRILQIGFIRTTNPSPLRKTILSLHEEIKADKYLKDIPSIEKTNIAFHAKDDVPEVREKVFKALESLDFKAEFIVARKRLDVFTKRHKRSEDVFYNEIIARLFERKLHKQDNIIYFSKRGNSLKQAHLANALQTAALNFERKHEIKVETKNDIYIQVPSDEPCLQITDYMNWAVQRAFTRSDMRYYNFVKEKVSFICDIYDMDKYPKNFYGKSNPFDIKKVSPL
jgi:hypothetical protein